MATSFSGGRSRSTLERIVDKEDDNNYNFKNIFSNLIYLVSLNTYDRWKSQRTATTFIFTNDWFPVLGGIEEDLDKLQQDFSDWLFSENPAFATSINIHKYDDQVDDYSTDIFDKWEVNKNQQSLDVIKTI